MSNTSKFDGQIRIIEKIKIPALVMHGAEDYLVDKSGGTQTSECIEGSELVIIPKMGHMPFNQKVLERFEHEIIRFLCQHKIF